MLGLFTGKKEKTYDQVAAQALSFDNDFWRLLVSHWDMHQTQSIQNALDTLDNDPEYRKQFRLSLGQYDGQNLLVSLENRPYVETLLNVRKLFIQVSKSIHKSERADTDYLTNSLVDVVYLMVNIDDSLRKGVPLQFETIREAVTIIELSLKDRLDDYYRMSSAELTAEIKIAKDMRRNYENRRDALKNPTKNETGA